jgi:hypothetical protein
MWVVPLTVCVEPRAPGQRAPVHHAGAGAVMHSVFSLWVLVFAMVPGKQIQRASVQSSLKCTAYEKTEGGQSACIALAPPQVRPPDARTRRPCAAASAATCRHRQLSCYGSSRMLAACLPAPAPAQVTGTPTRRRRGAPAARPAAPAVGRPRCPPVRRPPPAAPTRRGRPGRASPSPLPATRAAPGPAALPAAASRAAYAAAALARPPCKAGTGQAAASLATSGLTPIQHSTLTGTSGISRCAQRTM